MLLMMTLKNIHFTLYHIAVCSARFAIDQTIKGWPFHIDSGYIWNKTETKHWNNSKTGDTVVWYMSTRHAVRRRQRGSDILLKHMPVIWGRWRGTRVYGNTANWIHKGRVVVWRKYIKHRSYFGPAVRTVVTKWLRLGF